MCLKSSNGPQPPFFIAVFESAGKHRYVFLGLRSKNHPYSAHRWWHNAKNSRNCAQGLCNTNRQHIMRNLYQKQCIRGSTHVHCQMLLGSSSFLQDPEWRGRFGVPKSHKRTKAWYASRPKQTAGAIQPGKPWILIPTITPDLQPSDLNCNRAVRVAIKVWGGLRVPIKEFANKFCTQSYLELELDSVRKFLNYSLQARKLRPSFAPTCIFTAMCDWVVFANAWIVALEPH